MSLLRRSRPTWGRAPRDVAPGAIAATRTAAAGQRLTSELRTFPWADAASRRAFVGQAFVGRAFVGPRGFEPRTCGLRVRCSARLS